LLGFCIDRALRDLRQQLVRVPLFIERLLQKVRLLVEPELSRVRSYRAIARHLVMLDVLCFRDETGVEHLLGCVLLEQFLRFFDQPLHPFALLSRRAFAEHLEDLLEPLDVPFRFLKMVGERLLQLRHVGDMRQQPEFDLRIVGADKLPAWRRNKSAADATAFFRADGDVLQIGIDGRQTPRARRRQCKRGVHAAGVRVHICWERVGVGAAQFGEPAPVQRMPRNLVALRRQFLQHVGIGGPGAGFGLPAAGQLEGAEEIVAQLLGRADIELATGNREDFPLQARHGLRKRVGQLA